MASKKTTAKKAVAKKGVAKAAKIVKEENIIPKEVQAEVAKKPEVKVSAPVAPSMKRVLYAVDSPAMDDRIKADSLDKWKKVTVLVKDRESKASVDKFLKSRDLRLITTFAIQFQEEDFDVAFVEKSMLEFIPDKLIKKLKS